MNDPLEEIKQSLDNHVDGINTEFVRLRSLFRLATKEDLDQMEQRILAALGDVTHEDIAALNALLVRMDKTTTKLETIGRLHQEP